jgi:signal transduction histidine kinase
VAAVPLAIALVAFDAALDGWGLPLLAAVVVLAVLGGARAGRIAVGASAAAIAVAAAGHLHVRWEARHAAERAEGRIASRLRDLESRKTELVERVRGLGSRAAALPDNRAALSQDRAALVRLFRELESLRDDVADRPAVAVHHVPSLTVVAWSGRIGDPPVPAETMTGRDDVFVLEGSVSTTLVSITAIRSPDGSVRGLVTTALPVAVRRNIENEYLHDFDLLTGEDPRVEAVYVDVRQAAATSSDLPPLDPALRAREALLRGPDGDPLALVRVAAPGVPEIREALASRYRRLLSALAAAALLLWAGRTVRRPWRVALAAAGARALWAFLGPPWPGPAAPLLSSDVYASPLLGPLSRSPVDLLLTAAAALVAAACTFAAAHRRALPTPRLPTVAAALFAGALGVVGVVRLVTDTVARSAIDLETVTLVPPSQAHAVLQVALLAWVLAVLLLLGACLRWAGLWPRVLIALDARPAGARAVALLGLVALAGALLHPTLVALGQRHLQQRIAREEAPLVLRQREFRELVLQETQKRIDSLRILSDVPSGRGPGIEELAFAVWTSTDLAARGFSSAIEIQDADGVVISRFALNLPSLSSRPLPSNELWRVSREPSSLASTARTVLHARRLLTEEGQVHGAVHVYVADDYWNLPFLRTSDPYSLLFRPAARAPVRQDPLVLVAYGRGGDAVFSSVERTPPLPTALAAGLQPEGPGEWTVLSVDGQAHHAYLFAGQEDMYVLAYPRVSWGRRAGDLVEAVAACTLLALLGLAMVVLVRTGLRRRDLSLPSMLYAVQRRFALRLLVAFTVLAVAPVVVLQVVVRKFVSDRLWEEANKQGLERVSVARKAVEDFVFFQQGEPAGAEPVTDAALVWVASLIRNDLAVFERGRLAASSKRELYTSGLLAPRVSAGVYRLLILEGNASTLRTERIGTFSYLVASMPVRTADNSQGVLSLPLASRQREVEATVRDLDRSIRLASLVFLGLAALFAQQVARRISGPISALTSATRRIASGDLATRVQASSRDELMTLVESFNQMAGDLDRQRRDLERSNRLATWADMARQVAHEVKNPLTPIQLSAEHLRRVWRDRRIDFEGALEACTATILKQVRILRGIVTEFSAFARPPAAVLEPQDPARLVSDVIEPYRIALPPGVTLSVSSEGPVPAVLGDRRLLERALLNLLENALQAVGENGRVEVGLRAAEAGGRVELWVQDSGPGIDPELADRIFEPFFSTKTGGSGLGLPLVRKIAEDHGGGVSLSHPAEGGTRATLWLPARTQGHAA